MRQVLFVISVVLIAWVAIAQQPVPPGLFLVQPDGTKKFVNLGDGLAVVTGVNGARDTLTAAKVPGFIFNETPLVQGNKITLNAMPVNIASVRLYVNGVRLKPQADYTVMGRAVTLLFLSLTEKDTVLADYQY